MKSLLNFVILLTVNLAAQDTLVIESQFLSRPDSVLIFTPDKFSSEESLPAVILLHGWDGDYKQWSEITDLQQFADKYQFIIVAPDGLHDSWYLDSPLKADSKFETFFFEELMPVLSENYNPDTSNLFISGLSMGGHGAVTLALKNPGYFKAAGSTSGILDLTAFPDKWGIKNYLGDFNSNKENWYGSSAVYLLSSNKSTDTKFIIDCGTEDFAFPVNKKFKEKCAEFGIDIKFTAQPGNHSRDYWRKTIPVHFKYFNDLLNAR